MNDSSRHFMSSLMNRIERGTLKALFPLLGALIVEIFYGTMDDVKANEAHSALQKKLDNIHADTSATREGVVEIVKSICDLKEVNEKASSALDSLAGLIQDSENIAQATIEVKSAASSLDKTIDRAKLLDWLAGYEVEDLDRFIAIIVIKPQTRFNTKNKNSKEVATDIVKWAVSNAGPSLIYVHRMGKRVMTNWPSEL